jgi:transcriptional regulator with XRE-family HTH domain
MDFAQNGLNLQKLPSQVLHEIARSAKSRRKQRGLSQKELADRSGVSFGSIQRFEQSGLIALDSLLKIAFTLDCLEGFDALFPSDDLPKSLDDLFK